MRFISPTVCSGAGVRSRPRRWVLAAGVTAALAASALAAQLGETYEEVIAEKGDPLGRIDAGSTVLLRYRNAEIKLKDGVVVAITVPQESKPTPTPEPTAAETPSSKIAALKAQELKAVQRVQQIVNQPVNAIPRTKAMVLTGMPDGWFQPGAETPDFDHADVRTTQDTTPYLSKGFTYITSPANPGVVFLASDLAYNSQTKLFYTDLTVPKKLLTDDELQEINHQYRIIGRCSRELTKLGATPSLSGK